jgi:hypothetical protein
LNNILVRCISDEGFIQHVYHYLYVELEKHAKFEEGKNLQINTELVRLLPDNNEIEIDEKAQVPWLNENWNAC